MELSEINRSLLLDWFFSYRRCLSLVLVVLVVGFVAFLYFFSTGGDLVAYVLVGSYDELVYYFIWCFCPNL